MSEKDDGGPAFPHDTGLVEYDPNTNRSRHVGSAGMSMRDFFAAHALAGSLASGLGSPPGGFAQWAYECADMMLSERTKRSGT